jgi:hypothetical protein
VQLVETGVPAAAHGTGRSGAVARAADAIGFARSLARRTDGGEIEGSALERRRCAGLFRGHYRQARGRQAAATTLCLVLVVDGATRPHRTARRRGSRNTRRTLARTGGALSRTHGARRHWAQRENGGHQEEQRADHAGYATPVPGSCRLHRRYRIRPHMGHVPMASQDTSTVRTRSPTTLSAPIATPFQNGARWAGSMGTCPPLFRCGEAAEWAGARPAGAGRPTSGPCRAGTRSRRSSLR